MSTPIDLSLASLTASAPAQRVYTRHAWSDAWTLVPHLFCTSAQICVAPDIGKAMFTWRFGRGMQPGGVGFEDWPRLYFTEPYTQVDVSIGRIGRFIKVEADVTDASPTTTIYWYGYVIDSDEEREGVLNLPPLDDPDGDPIRIPSGTQQLMALELTWLLTECNIESSVVATSSDPPDTTRIKAPLAFNTYKGAPRDTGGFITRNRSLNRFATPAGAGDSYLFSNSLAPDEAEQWTTFDIIEYLLAWHSPQPLVGGGIEAPPVVRFRIDSSGVHDDCLKWEFPRLRTEGRTVWECLTTLLDRRRSLGFYCQVDDSVTPNEVVLFPFPYNADPITVTDADGNATTIPGNDNLRTLDVDNNHFANTQIRRSASVKYDEVVVRGGRRRSVFNLYHDGNDGSTLDADWSSSEQTDYNTGASGAADYPERAALRAIRNKQVRSTDALARVYRYFRVPLDWNFKGYSAFGNEYVMPRIESDGSINQDASEELWRPGLRLLRHLPMLKGWDYSTSASDPTDNTGGAEPEYMETWAVVRLPPDGTGNAKYSYSHDLAESLRILAMAYKSSAFNISVRPQDNECGVVLDVSGDEQHMIAKDEFTPLADAADEDGHFDWAADIIVVVAMEGDSYCEAVWPPTPDLPNSTLLKRRLVIDAGDGYRLDYMMEGTFTGIENGEIQANQNGGLIRDDRGELLSMARLAYEWYSRERVAIDLSIRAIATDFSLGHLITTFGSAESQELLNSVITSILWHFGNSPEDQPHTMVHTNYAELDPGSMVRRRG